MFGFGIMKINNYSCDENDSCTSGSRSKEGYLKRNQLPDMRIEGGSRLTNAAL